MNPLVLAGLLLLAVPVRAEKTPEDSLRAAQGAFDSMIRDARARPVPAAPPAASAAYSPRFDSDVPAALRAQFLSDMSFVGGLSAAGATPLHRAILGRVGGDDYFRYLDRRVKSLGVSDGNARPGVVAYVSPISDSSKMVIGRGYTTLNLPQIYRVVVVFHEARHTEDANANWRHANCPVPFRDADGKDIVGIFSGTLLAGLPACDDTAIGAYGVGLLMFRNIEKFCSNCSGKVLMDAALYGEDTYKRIVGPAARAKLHADLYQ